MITEYKIVQFEHLKDYQESHIQHLSEFIADAEIILSDYGLAWPKSFINKVEDSHRGAILRFVDGELTYWYNISAKLVNNSNELCKTNN
jgi:hypothetical protein